MLKFVRTAGLGAFLGGQKFGRKFRFVRVFPDVPVVLLLAGWPDRWRTTTGARPPAQAAAPSPTLAARRRDAGWWRRVPSHGTPASHSRVPSLAHGSPVGSWNMSVNLCLRSSTVILGDIR